MIEVVIPGDRTLQLEYLVLDHNGTLAVDGFLQPGVKERLRQLSKDLTIYVVTADTFGKAAAQLKGIPCELTILPAGSQDVGKLEFIQQLGKERTACMGNGRNDRLMLAEAALGVAVILAEGAAVETILAADVVCNGIAAALELLLHPLRLTATLRS